MRMAFLCLVIDWKAGDKVNKIAVRDDGTPADTYLAQTKPGYRYLYEPRVRSNKSFTLSFEILDEVCDVVFNDEFVKKCSSAGDAFNDFTAFFQNVGTYHYYLTADGVKKR